MLVKSVDYSVIMIVDGEILEHVSPMSCRECLVLSRIVTREGAFRLKGFGMVERNMGGKRGNGIIQSTSGKKTLFTSRAFVGWLLGEGRGEIVRFC